MSHWPVLILGTFATALPVVLGAAFYLGRKKMKEVDDLKAAVASLKATVDASSAKLPNTVDPAALVALTGEVAAMDAQLKAAHPPV